MQAPIISTTSTASQFVSVQKDGRRWQITSFILFWDDCEWGSNDDLRIPSGLSYRSGVSSWPVSGPRKQAPTPRIRKEAQRALWPEMEGLVRLLIHGLAVGWFAWMDISIRWHGEGAAAATAETVKKDRGCLRMAMEEYRIIFRTPRAKRNKTGMEWTIIIF